MNDLRKLNENNEDSSNENCRLTKTWAKFTVGLVETLMTSVSTATMFGSEKAPFNCSVACHMKWEVV